MSDAIKDLIETFPSGQTKPSNTINCLGQCFSFAFNHFGNHIWVADYSYNGGSLDEVEYPSGKLISSASAPANQGVATSPDLYL